MKLITEDINNKTFLIQLTKDELDEIEGLATSYEFRTNKRDITDEDEKFLCDLHNLCATVYAHIFSNK